MPKDEVREFMLIGIGSSAGGLEAIRELVSTLPNDAKVAYVVVQHMSPNHKSLMTELVGRETNLSVKDVKDGEEPEANVIYVTPPRFDVVVRDKKLRLMDPSPDAGAPKPSVNRFLISLAEDMGENSMAIVLSGTGSDGAYGVQAIREAGGITIAQDDASAKYDGMPVSAIETGCVDLILRPSEIGRQLKKILLSPRDFIKFRKDDLKSSPASDLLQILLARTRVDFRDYKQATVQCRIERRMVVLGIETEAEYTAYCRENPHAVDALFKDLLISVTRFFRDRSEFDQLALALPEIVSVERTGPIRVWIAGCATGEEAYSIAILLADAIDCEPAAIKDHLQIFATDIDQDALKVARTGVYGVDALNDIPKQYAEKYFVRQGDAIRVVETVRSTILFSDHNLCQDPPFQNIDLICCRNLLIYFGNNLQQKAMARFHYSMRESSLLFLGTAESVAGADDRFVSAGSKANIFRKRTLKAGSARPGQQNIHAFQNQSRLTPPPTSKVQPSADRLLFEALAASLGENSVLVSDDFSIIRVFGDVSNYVEMTEASSLRMQINLLRSPLREEARSLVTLALKNGKRRSGIRHLLDGDNTHDIRLDVVPIHAKTINEKAVLVIFVPLERKAKPSDIEVTTDLGDKQAIKRIQALESEVNLTREALQQTIEELETSNEELQSLNEELQSTNEELQATNEELETSNEELQSTNEELITVNEELQINASELSEKTGKLDAVIGFAPLAILVVDSALQVSHASPAAKEMFGLKEPISRPHVSQTLQQQGFPNLAHQCNEAVQTGQNVMSEFLSKGVGYEMNCAPFFDAQARILGVTVSVTNFRGLGQEMAMILNESPFQLMSRDQDGKILRISEASAAALGKTRKEAEGANIFDILEPKTGESIRTLDKQLFANPNEKLVETFKVQPKEGGEASWLSTTRICYEDPATEEKAVFALGNDCTELMQKKQAIAVRSKQAELLQDDDQIGFWEYDIGSGGIIWSPGVYRLLGLDPDEFTPHAERFQALCDPDDYAKLEPEFAAALEAGRSVDWTGRLTLPNEKVISLQCRGDAVTDDAGDIVMVAGYFRRLSD